MTPVAHTAQTELGRGNVGMPAVLMIAYTDYETDPRVIRAAEAACEAGFRVDVIVLRRPGQPASEVIRGVHVRRVAQHRYRGPSRVQYAKAYLEFFLRTTALAARLHWTRRYRVVHVNNMPDVLVFTALVPRVFGAKVILDIHDPMPETFCSKYGGANGSALYRGLAMLERMSVAFAHEVVTVNEPVRDEILQRRPYRQKAIGVIANFADDRVFKTLPPAVINGRVRFVFHGTILERYGLRTLIEAVVKARSRQRFEIRIIGEGDYSIALRDLIEQSGVGDVVTFTNRAFPMREMPAMLSDCHVGLVPLDVTPISDFALPLKLIEYTALGLPSITIRSRAIAHYFHPDECLFYDSGDSSALAQMLDNVADNPECLEQYRRKLPAIRARLSWTREKDKYVQMLARLSGHEHHAAVTPIDAPSR